MQQINKLTEKVLVLCYFGECWKYPGMPDQTQQILNYLTKALMDI